MTATEGLLVPPGHGRVVRAPAQHVTFKVTGSHSRTASTFEVIVPPGFDVGAHVHTRSEELFYVLEGELDVLATRDSGDGHRRTARLPSRVREPDGLPRQDVLQGVPAAGRRGDRGTARTV